MRLLATLLGQDLETGGDGVLRVARKVANDRVISTVDPQVRHGHKASHRGFDGYKGHIAVDPDAEVITATAVTAGNSGDAQPVADLIADLTDPPATTETETIEASEAAAPDAAAVNLTGLATLGLGHTTTRGWTLNPT